MEIIPLLGYYTRTWRQSVSNTIKYDCECYTPMFIGNGARPEMSKWVGVHKTGWAKREYENSTPNYQKYK